MVGATPLLLLGRRGTENLEPAIHLKGIRIHDLTSPRLRQRESEPGLAGGRRAAKVKRNGVHVMTLEKESPSGKDRTG